MRKIKTEAKVMVETSSGNDAVAQATPRKPKTPKKGVLESMLFHLLL